MTPQEHYEAAEFWARRAEDVDTKTVEGAAWMAGAAAIGQIHATLATQPKLFVISSDADTEKIIKAIQGEQ